MWKKIKGKLYIIKVYREPLKKLHTSGKNPQQQERGSNEIMQQNLSNQIKLSQTCNKIHLVFHEKHAKWNPSFSFVILMFLFAFLLTFCVSLSFLPIYHTTHHHALFSNFVHICCLSLSTFHSYWMNNVSNVCFGFILFLILIWTSIGYFWIMASVLCVRCINVFKCFFLSVWLKLSLCKCARVIISHQLYMSVCECVRVCFCTSLYRARACVCVFFWCHGHTWEQMRPTKPCLTLNTPSFCTCAALCMPISCGLLCV